MTPARRRLLRITTFAISAIALTLLLLFVWGWNRVEQSLPLLAGEVTLKGLSAPATLSRDGLGTAVIEAKTAEDAARLLGFAHGQDRFFQMDLSRRRGAGELSALLGKAALDMDRMARPHRFRILAEQVVQQEPAPRRARLVAYAEGVNAGLASLPAKPWEYLLLRTEPEPWTPEDTVLALYAMAFDLQDSAGNYEQTLTTLRDQLGQAAVNFFSPLVGPGDAALDGSRAPLPAPPSARALNLRAEPALAALPPAGPDLSAPGSNALLLAGGRTRSGAALLAGDPHLDLRVPNTWYRASLAWTEPDGRPVRVVGASLPGVPGIVIGSNGHLAWTLTNSYADTGDLVALDLHPAAPEMFYQAGSDILEFERRTDTITVKGEEPVTVETTWSKWGPVVSRSARGKHYAYRWTLHDPAAANFALLDLATATTLDAGLAIGHAAGIPPNNLFLAHRSGAAAWTIAGRLPERFGFDGRFPVSWTFGDRGWRGFLPPDAIPVVRVTAEEALWSGNQRKLGGEALRRIGDGGYEDPRRALHLRDALHQLGVAADERAAPADLLALQRDTRGLWLERWRTLLLQTLDDAALAEHPPRREFRRLLETEPELRADPGNVAYRLVRGWHTELQRQTLHPIFARCVRANPQFNPGRLNTEDALWALHEREPLHLLALPHADWAALRLSAVDAVIAELEQRDVPLAEATWGARNRAALRHAFSGALPFGLSRWIDLPAEPLPGDKLMPLVQGPTFGASLRLVVAPGQEEEGVLHLPGGQSGHPLSPYYRAGHRDWVAGRPTPLLPGEIEHRLTLQPRPATAP